MKKIKKSFTRLKVSYKLVERKGNIALYSCSLGKCTNYEVHVIRSHNGREIAGKQIEPAEYLATDREFGRLAWSYTSIDSAKVKMHTLLG